MVGTAPYRRYLILLLLCGLMVTNLERQLMALAMQPIKDELGLSDSQLGLLTGIAFALFFSLLGFPIARIADRGNRVRLIAITTAICSVAVTLCGTARSFSQLLLIRIGVAFGETGFAPAANSLIADSFARQDQPKALSRYMLGGPLSYLIGSAVGGWLIQSLGWRTTFVIAGCPGLVVATVVWLTLRDQRKAGLKWADGQREHVNTRLSARQPSLKAFFRTVWSSRTFRQLTYGYTVLSFVDCGRTQWTPTFFIRSFGVDITSLGILSALIFGLSSVCGMLLGGYVCARYAAGQERLQLRAMALVYATVAILSVVVSLSHSAVVAFAFTGLAIVLGSATTAPSFSIVQSLVPDNMRAQATALLLLLANLVGLGLGPLVAGALSDGMRALFGTESLRYSLLIFSPGYIWCGWHSWLAGRTVPTELAAMESSASGRPGLCAVIEPFSTAPASGWSATDRPLNPPP